MAVTATVDEVKVVLKFTKGSQTIPHCNQSVSDDALYALGDAISSLNAEKLEDMMKVTETKLVQTV